MCDFRSLGYCGETPLNENNEATLIGVLIIIRNVFNIKNFMIKHVLELKMTILIVVSSLLA